MQSQLADFWWYEHLLSLPDIPDEVVNHFGEFPEQPGGSMPAFVSARLFLRYVRKHGSAVEDHAELLQILGFLQLLAAAKANQFRSAAAATAVDPPLELMVQVFLQAVISSCLQLQQAGQLLDAAAVAQQAEELLQQTSLGHLQEEQPLRAK
ncbi:hypothetical protein OEZ85_006146 [Tetradesmus obliquus]|uniref:Uncharacterized protein n=1 Tax=Tetradesmus obliquus TaxID=3088 RepID=A0ABY8UGZ6_TETOB|nr:hypothetical protein OEZ85_006146 [Tetradesmus obliquus]